MPKRLLAQVVPRPRVHLAEVPTLTAESRESGSLVVIAPSRPFANTLEMGVEREEG